MIVRNGRTRWTTTTPVIWSSLCSEKGAETRPPSRREHCCATTAKPAKRITNTPPVTHCFSGIGIGIGTQFQNVSVRRVSGFRPSPPVLNRGTKIHPGEFPIHPRLFCIRAVEGFFLMEFPGRERVCVCAQTQCIVLFFFLLEHVEVLIRTTAQVRPSGV